MGPANDKESVVNYKLQVYGIKRLCVVDAGITPSPPTPHTNAPVCYDCWESIRYYKKIIITNKNLNYRIVCLSGVYN